ncbi:MAG TPA: metal ABC transporter permease [Ilumatobacteraceae bacterium]|nr:metal ABC transporter permease [Ilumatobacteraceae bacterium]
MSAATFATIMGTIDALQYDFMRRALIAALLVGLAAPAVGIFLVQRRLALIGDGLGHVAITGVALGLVLDRAPVTFALAAAIAGAVAIEVIRSRREAFAELALALLFYGGLGGGIVLASRAPSGNRNLTQYLFGSITTTSASDVRTFAVLAAVVLVSSIGLRRVLFTVSNDEEFAPVSASGTPVMAVNLALAVLSALTVVVSMRIVGVLLVSALMVVPVAAAQMLARSFWQTFTASMVIGVGVAVCGVFVSFYADTPPGGTIVLLAIGVFALAFLGATAARSLLGAHRRR